MAVGSPQKWARSAPSPLWGEGWGEGNMRPPCGLRIPTTNWHGRLPLLFWERVGVRGNMRPLCGLREPYNKLARSAPSPLWGEGWGEREHATSLWAEGALQKYWHGRLPLLFGEGVGVRGNMRPPCGLRDPYKKLARSAPSPLWGEGWGEGIHATQVVVPFTLRSALLCQPRHP